MNCNHCKLFSSAIFFSLLFISFTITANNPFAATTPVSKTELPTVGNISEYASSNIPEEEKILVILADAYGIQNYSKVIITDVDMELSVLIAKDIFEKFPRGIYTVVASSANDLVSQKLIIQ